MPGWCDPLLEPPLEGDVLASRLWYDTTLAQAMPPGAEPLLAEAGAAVLPLLRVRGRLRALSTPYTLSWRPLVAPGTDAAALHAAGLDAARLLRRQPPVLLDALDGDAPTTRAFLGGLRAAGLAVLCHAHFGNWHEALPDNTGWAAYLAARPPALRATIGRKLARAARSTGFELLGAPGPALEAGIAAYEAVRSRSWKPREPAPGFDPALMRAAAAAGVLRLGVLRDADGAPLAAQYWLLDRGGRRATLLKLSHVESARAASPGTVLTALSIQHLLDVDGVRELDFGRGDDAYKQLWVGQRRQRIGAVIADPLHPAGLLAVARHAAGRARRAWRRRFPPAAQGGLPG
ncbi:GNAT family N-acetyltransferase [Roseomonas sp. BN140053]|uniref:GNAT family N-acetyltransferase n=1 Tax=Roseomonas sp. BN140053 TaxID=3391898 RepID=UPI0039EAECA6